MKILSHVIITEQLHTLQNLFDLRLVFLDGSAKATFSTFLETANLKHSWFRWGKLAQLGKMFYLYVMMAVFNIELSCPLWQWPLRFIFFAVNMLRATGAKRCLCCNTPAVWKTPMGTSRSINFGGNTYPDRSF